MAVITKKKLWRGLARQRLNKLESALNMLIDQDYRTYQITKEGAVVYWFIEEDDDELNDAVNLVLARIAACKAAEY